MSTIKVNAIESQAADSAPTIAGLQYPTAGALSNRNIIINGAMQVGQRNNVANETAPKYGKVDRFEASVGGSTNKNYNLSQVTACVPQEGFPFGLEYENINSVTPGADDFVIINQPVEGANLQAIKKGTANALPVTLSFFARSSRAGTYIVELYDVDNARTISKTYSLVQDQWKHVVLTYPADTTGAFDNDNQKSLNISFWLGAGSNFAGGGSLNTGWQNNVDNERAAGLESSFMTTAGSTFNLTGVQLEVGDKATPFEHRSYADELIRCHRYYQLIVNEKDKVVGGGTYYTDTRVFAQVPLTTRMRTTSPSAEVAGDTNSFVIYTDGAGDECAAPGVAARQSDRAIEFDFISGVSKSGASGESCFIRSFNTDAADHNGDTAYLAAEDEL